MFGMLGCEVLEEVGVVSGLITAQLAMAGSVILIGYVMSFGINPLTCVICGNLITALLYFPLSLIFERNKWPKKFSLKLMSQFLLISFAGITMFQSLTLYGVKKTSPALASVMPNLAPGFIFITACILRYEKIEMKSWYTKLKILGTLACIIGALLMSTMHHDASGPISLNTLCTLKALNQERIIGTACLLGGVIILSFNIIMQAIIMGNFPAPISLHVIMSIFGAIFTAILQLITEHKLEISSLVTAANLMGFTVLSSVLVGAADCFQGWAIKKKGPVFVSTFSPIGTVFSVILSALTLGYAVTMTGLAGMFLIFAGLYSVLWAKKKETVVLGYEDEEEDNCLSYKEASLELDCWTWCIFKEL